MKQFIPTIANLCFVVIAFILIIAFGRKIGFGFMLVALLIVVLASAVSSELLKHRRKKLHGHIKESLVGEKMCDVLKRHPDRLLKMQSWDEGQLAAVLDALDADDARCVRELLGKRSGSE